MKLATWNVNSVRARIERVLEWVDRAQPDVLCLQETKVTDPLFPHEPFAARGYQVETFGQKSYNGVAIASKLPLEQVARGFRDDGPEAESRLIAATVAGIRVVDVYVPNGRAVDSPHFAAKLEWLRRLRAHLTASVTPGQPLLLCGDFNVAPEDRDVYDPEAFRNQVHCHPDERRALQSVAAIGLVDVFRRFRPEPGLYSWWDYRQGAFHRNWGLRIDHIWMTEAVAARATGAAIDREARKGKQPSDHAPVLVELSD